jgi:hypothetical protein
MILRGDRGCREFRWCLARPRGRRRSELSRPTIRHVWEKKKLCFEVWKYWQSEAMRRDRIEAWRTLEELAEAGAMSERSLKDLEHEADYQFYTVCHFFADLNALLAEGVGR